MNAVNFCTIRGDCSECGEKIFHRISYKNSPREIHRISHKYSPHRLLCQIEVKNTVNAMNAVKNE